VRETWRTTFELVWLHYTVILLHELV